MSVEVDIAKRRGGQEIGARFATAAGLTALYGPSGAGKTSILDMVAGLLRPDRGRIAIGGETLFDAAEGVDVPPQQRRAGYVFQDARLFPHRRVRGNLLYGHALARLDRRWIGLNEVVDLLGIGHLLDRWPRTLSGGEARRVAIGRALLSGPRFLLMDEPFAALDPARREELLRLVERIRDTLRLPILYVSHDRAEVERLAGAVIAVAPLASGDRIG